MMVTTHVNFFALIFRVDEGEGLYSRSREDREEAKEIELN